jgi:hypothetical protein
VLTAPSPGFLAAATSATVLADAGRVFAAVALWTLAMGRRVI